MSSPATAARSTGRPPGRCCARTATTSRRCASAGRRPRRCRAVAVTPSNAACTRRTSRGSGKLTPHEHVAPGQASVGLARGGEAERLIERDRAVVVLVGVQLDPPRTARAGTLEGGEHQRAADALPARVLLDEQILEPAIR